MIILKYNYDLYESDFRQMIQAFFFGERIVTEVKGKVVKEEQEAPIFVFDAWFGDGSDRLDVEDTEMAGQSELSSLEFGEIIMRILVDGVCQAQERVICRYRDRKASRNQVKAAAYHLLSGYTGRTLPWGSMTGVRPTKFATRMVEEGYSDEEIIHEYESTYLTTRQKGEICCRVARKEQALLAPFHFQEEYCLYIGIPFCPTRCLYCSFASYSIEACADKVEPYLQALFRELDYAAKAYADRRLVAVYMGGGTPTALSTEQICRLIEYISSVFDTSSVREFTVEAGRPDSLTEDKLYMMHEHPVTRISINPQTMNQKTLDYIGRVHTTKQILETYELARKIGFDNINMDIIVGLPKETMLDIRHTLDNIRKLRPESLTVHSLALKRSAELNIQMDKYRDSITGSTDEMLMAADETARALGLEPYYLYRQKNIPGNLENVGYAASGKECLYNVLIMEEKMDIIAVGAGTSTKMVYPDAVGRIENVKNLNDYIQRVDEMIARKEAEFRKKGILSAME
ncbi:MAG: coproporphyrinogen dehydrogenase HemZ [Lachnospiraceae bacterium]|nr:coproporphyrinogen dehydrogenase HemZ [Lachnospiraceae bacterium]